MRPKLRAFAWTTRRNFCDQAAGHATSAISALSGSRHRRDDVTSQAWGLNERGQIVGTSCPAVRRLQGVSVGEAA